MKREPQSDSDDDRHSSKGGKSNSGSGGGGGGGGGSSSSARGKRFRGNDESIRILVPSKIAGALIGKGGQHINRLRSEFKSIINVEDCQGPERTLSISGEYENAVSVVEEMLKNFDEKDGEIDCRLLVHQSLAGCVIGKGGHKIKEVRDKIGCRVLKVFSNVCPQSSDRVMQCIGKLDHCLEAIREIYELIRDVPIRGPVHNYDPINYDDMFADKYGGFGEGGPDGAGSGGGGGGGSGGGSSSYHRGGGSSSGESGRYRESSRFSSSEHRRDEERGGYSRRGSDMGGSRRHESSRDSRGGGGSGRSGSGSGISSSADRGREFIDPWAPNSGPPGAGHFSSASGNGFGSGSDSYGAIGGGGGGSYGSSMGGGYGSNGSSMAGGYGGVGGHAAEYAHRQSSGSGGAGVAEDKNTTQVTIPKDLAGAIIGKAGQRIRQIRMESNAFITIDEPLPGSTDRIITITGSPKEIQMAQYLLQQSVHDTYRQY